MRFSAGSIDGWAYRYSSTCLHVAGWREHMPKTSCVKSCHPVSTISTLFLLPPCARLALWPSPGLLWHRYTSLSPLATAIPPQKNPMPQQTQHHSQSRANMAATCLCTRVWNSEYCWHDAERWCRWAKLLMEKLAWVWHQAKTNRIVLLSLSETDLGRLRQEWIDKREEQMSCQKNINSSIRLLETQGQALHRRLFEGHKGHHVSASTEYSRLLHMMSNFFFLLM